MDLTLQVYLIVLPAVFLAGLVDSIAGGGGLLSVPAYMAAGLPPHFVLGNNKFSSSFGTLCSTLRYHRHGLIDLPLALLSALVALAGSFLGTSAVLLLRPDFLRYLLLVLIPLAAVLILSNRSFGREDRSQSRPRRHNYLIAAPAALLIGFYDGFFGPGTGTFLILVFTLALKYDLVAANANTKVVNLASNLAAVATFVVHGKVLFLLGVPAALAGIAGNLLGSKLVIRRGSRLIRPVFVLTLLLLFGKVLYDLIAAR
ncbi:MAG: TSUP family transporter [Candidatus Aminicenantes bacterium]|nr:TSUP family transporter [Candidatus Aminicenantes bacterium]